MNRRQFIITLGVVPLAGCSSVSSGGSSLKPLGEPQFFGELRIAATDAMTAKRLTTIFETSSGTSENTYTAPSDSTFALFSVSVENTHIADWEAPALNTANYTTLTQDDDGESPNGVNDIRIFGGSEGGQLPATDGSDPLWYNRIRVDGSVLETYPPTHSGTGPNLQPSDVVSGWTFALIPADAQPRLRVTFDDQTVTWESE